MIQIRLFICVTALLVAMPLHAQTEVVLKDTFSDPVLWQGVIDVADSFIFFSETSSSPVSYTHLTLPTKA